MNKVWTYVISKELKSDDLKQLQALGTEFVSGWTAHENRLSARFDIFEKRILIIQVNEQVASASGCSIDKLLRFVKEMENNFEVTLLDRLLVAYRTSDGIGVEHTSTISSLLKNNVMNENTIVFNTAASTAEELSVWEQTLKDTWLKKYLVKV